MRERAWEILGFAALAIITFICSLIAIRWAIDFISWGVIDSGWAQAIGAVGAIAGSVFIATRQERVAARFKKIEALETQYSNTHLCLRLAIDTCNCLSDIVKKISRRQTATPGAIGKERLEQLQLSLNTCASKPILPDLLSEILVLQRETAYTLMAVRKIGKRVATARQLEKAIKRRDRAVRSRETLRKYARVRRSARDQARL